MPCTKCTACGSSNPVGGGSGSPPSTTAPSGNVFPLWGSEPSYFEVQELAPGYEFTQERELDTWVRALGRGKIHKDTLTELFPGATKRDISASVKRLYSRGYLTNAETQDVMKLFGGW